MRSVVLSVPPRGVAVLAAFFAILMSSAASYPALAQDAAGVEALPPIDVISTRIGTTSRRSTSGARSTTTRGAPSSGDGAGSGNSVTSDGEPVTGGITGASTTIITSEEIERAPQSNL